jgi:hypothetical protein
MAYKKLKNPWKPEDEGDHYPVMKEWWTIESIFYTKKSNQKWNLICSFSYKLEDRSCFFQYILFNISSGKCIAHKDVSDTIDKISFKKNRIELTYKNCSISGSYPQYIIHIEDEREDLSVDMRFSARSLPHWIAQEKTNGYLPIGLNYYRYGFLPNCTLSGSFKLKNSINDIQGTGYIEHAWGNWSYQHPFRKVYNLRKTLSIYIKLGKWWLSEHSIRIPHRIGFATENNTFGYDWIWGIADNGWSLFFGNSMFWIKEGPSFGALYVTPNGKTYWEFCNVTFRYNKVIYLKKYDIEYPSEVELWGKLGEKTIHIRFWKTTESYEYIDPFKKNKFYKAWILCEMPGQMEGSYSDGYRTINFSGDCKIVPLRLPSILGHNALTLSLFLPPKGFGFDLNLDSHRLKKIINANVQLLPKLNVYWKIKRSN